MGSPYTRVTTGLDSGLPAAPATLGNGSLLLANAPVGVGGGGSAAGILVSDSANGLLRRYSGGV